MFKKLKEYIEYNWSFLGVLNSPLKSLRLRWYFGDIKMGTPYFLPRKWVKMTEADCMESLEKAASNAEKHGWKFSREKTLESLRKSTKAVPIKYFGINWNTLGWKTKWSEFRFEYNPGLSIVLFGKQLCITILPDIDPNYWDSYWEAWLNYTYRTNKKLSKKERLKELVKEYSCTWSRYIDGVKFTKDHYNFILKPKYQKIYESKN